MKARNIINCFSPNGTGGLFHYQTKLKLEGPFSRGGVTVGQLSGGCVCLCCVGGGDAGAVVLMRGC